TQTLKSKCDSLIKVGRALAVRDRDGMGGTPAVGREIVEQIDLAVKLDDCQPVARSQSVKKASCRELDILPEGLGRAAHIEEHYDTKGCFCRFKTAYILRYAVFENSKIRRGQSGNRAAAIVYDAHIQPDDRRVDANRVVVLRPQRQRCGEG